MTVFRSRTPRVEVRRGSWSGREDRGPRSEGLSLESDIRVWSYSGRGCVVPRTGKGHDPVETPESDTRSGISGCEVRKVQPSPWFVQGSGPIAGVGV